MHFWDGWPVERLLYLFVGVAYIMMWIQLTLFHWRGGFHHKVMWGPVIYTPIAFIITLLVVFMRGNLLDTVFVVVLAVAVLVGMIGVFFHFRGIGSQVGGMTLRNLMAGPPPILPMMYMAMGAIGLLVYYWQPAPTL